MRSNILYDIALHVQRVIQICLYAVYNKQDDVENVQEVIFVFIRPEKCNIYFYRWKPAIWILHVTEAGLVTA